MKTIKLELTPAQYIVLSNIVYSTEVAMEWDEVLNAYSDGGRFLLSLDKNEMRAFKNLVKRI